MSPLKCIRLRSHAASEFEGERIDACSRAARACWYSPNFRLEKSIFVLSLVLPGGPPQALVPVGALSDHGLAYFIFYCNNHVTSFFTRHWELRFDVAPELGLLRGLSCGVRSFDEESGSLAMRSVQCRRVLPQWRCSIERIPPERLARPISQACTRRLCSPRLRCSSLRELISNRCSKIFVQAGPRAPAHEVFTRTLKYTTNY